MRNIPLEDGVTQVNSQLCIILEQGELIGVIEWVRPMQQWFLQRKQNRGPAAVWSADLERVAEYYRKAGFSRPQKGSQNLDDLSALQ